MFAKNNRVVLAWFTMILLCIVLFPILQILFFQEYLYDFTILDYHTPVQSSSASSSPSWNGIPTSHHHFGPLGTKTTRRSSTTTSISSRGSVSNGMIRSHNTVLAKANDDNDALTTRDCLWDANTLIGKGPFLRCLHTALFSSNNKEHDDDDNDNHGGPVTIRTNQGTTTPVEDNLPFMNWMNQFDFIRTTNQSISGDRSRITSSSSQSEATAKHLKINNKNKTNKTVLTDHVILRYGGSCSHFPTVAQLVQWIPSYTARLTILLDSQPNFSTMTTTQPTTSTSLLCNNNNNTNIIQNFQSLESSKTTTTTTRRRMEMSIGEIYKQQITWSDLFSLTHVEILHCTDDDQKLNDCYDIMLNATLLICTSGDGGNDISSMDCVLTGWVRTFFAQSTIVVKSSSSSSTSSSSSKPSFLSRLYSGIRKQQQVEQQQTSLLSPGSFDSNTTAKDYFFRIISPSTKMTASVSPCHASLRYHALGSWSYDETEGKEDSYEETYWMSKVPAASTKLERKVYNNSIPTTTTTTLPPSPLYPFAAYSWIPTLCHLQESTNRSTTTSSITGDEGIIHTTMNGTTTMSPTTTKTTTTAATIQRMNKDGFCRVMHQLNISRFMIVGDSLQFMALLSMMHFLGYTSDEVEFRKHLHTRNNMRANQTILCAHDINSNNNNSNSKDEHDTKELYDPFEVEFIYFRTNHLMPLRVDDTAGGGGGGGGNNSMTSLAVMRDVVKRRFHAVSKSEQKLGAEYYSCKAHNGPLPDEYGYCAWVAEYLSTESVPTLLWTGVGSHFHHEDAFVESMDSFMKVLQENKRPDDVILLRTQHPGHAGCVNTSRDEEIPYASFQEYQDLGVTSQFDWNLMSRHNKYMEELVWRSSSDSWRGATLVLNDIYWSTAMRRDGHVTAKDCLHYLLPGPPDWWVHFLYNDLLELVAGIP